MVQPNLGHGVAVIGSSGGQAAVAVDLAHRDGLKLPRFRQETMELLRENAAPGSFLDNPIDLVGRPGAKSAIGDIFHSVYTDKGIGFVLSPWSVIFPDDSLERKTQREAIQLAVSTAQRSGTPTVVSSLVVVPWTDWMLQLRYDNPDVAVVRGIETTIRALSHLFPRGSDDDDDDNTEVDVPHDTESYVVLGEVEGREILSALGLPLVRGYVVRTGDEAADALSKLRPPVVVKADIVGVAHKAKLGLVHTNCWNAEEVRRVVLALNDRFDELGLRNDSVVGILVEEMALGTELLVGLTNSVLGRFLTVGVGGVDAKAGTSVRTVMLPTSCDVIQGACAEILRKRSDASDVVAAANVIGELAFEFSEGALAQYSTVEINPLFVSGESALIADVLIERSHD
jgi:acyl-CoA synthetase (NDP forming)